MDNSACVTIGKSPDVEEEAPLLSSESSAGAPDAAAGAPSPVSAREIGVVGLPPVSVEPPPFPAGPGNSLASSDPATEPANISGVTNGKSGSSRPWLSSRDENVSSTV